MPYMIKAQDLPHTLLALIIVYSSLSGLDEA